MAGQQRGRAFRASLDEKGGIDWVENQVLRGRSMRSVALEIGCGRWWLDRWVHSAIERKRTVARARACGVQRRQTPTEAGPIPAPPLGQAGRSPPPRMVRDPETNDGTDGCLNVDTAVT